MTEAKETYTLYFNVNGRHCLELVGMGLKIRFSLSHVACNKLSRLVSLHQKYSILVSCLLDIPFSFLANPLKFRRMSIPYTPSVVIHFPIQIINRRAGLLAKLLKVDTTFFLRKLAVVGRKATFHASQFALPPVVCTISLFNHLDPIPFFETQITFPLAVECVEGYGIEA